MILYMGCDGRIDENLLSECEKSGKYVAEPKKDGIWCAVVSTENGQFFFSRNGKLKDITLPTLPYGTILCGELGYGSAESTDERSRLGHDYMDIFDAISYGNIPIGHFPDDYRRTLLETVQEKSAWKKEYSNYFRIVPRWKDSFKEHYEDEREGLILKLKNVDRKYLIGTRHPHWYKVKKYITVDMIVTGYTLSDASSFKGLDYARNLICGVYKDGKIVDTTHVSVQDYFLKSDIVANWENYKCKVIELKTYKIFKSGGLRHPSIVKFRDDKRPEECTWKSLMERIFK